MALILCPKCGQKVASIATSCPHCAYSFTEHRLRDESARREKSCQACDRSIPARTRVCPYCQERQPAVRVNLLVLGVPMVVAAAVAIGALLLRGSGEQPPPPLPATASAETATVPTEPAVRPITPQVQPVRARVQQTKLSQPEPADIRWATTWANVRGRRGTAGEVIGVLEPGQRIQVDSLRAGWWLVYVDGERLGYVANSVLQLERPESP